MVTTITTLPVSDAIGDACSGERIEPTATEPDDIGSRTLLFSGSFVKIHSGGVCAFRAQLPVMTTDFWLNQSRASCCRIVRKTKSARSLTTPGDT